MNLSLNNISVVQQGWQCPVCYAVMSPSTAMCLKCPQKNETINGTSATPYTSPMKTGDTSISIPNTNTTKCNHEWDYSLVYATNPPKLKCLKCKEYSRMPIESFIYKHCL